MAVPAAIDAGSSQARAGEASVSVVAPLRHDVGGDAGPAVALADVVPEAVTAPPAPVAAPAPPPPPAPVRPAAPAPPPVAAPAPPPPPPPPPPPAPGRSLGEFVVTCYAIEGRTATGSRTHAGGVAVDPSVIPFGTRIDIQGVGVRVANDTGPRLRGQRLDIWASSESACVAFGRRVLDVRLAA